MLPLLFILFAFATAPAHAIVTGSLSPGSPTGHAIPATGPDTCILAVTLTGSIPDTLTACTVTLTGLLPAQDVDTVALLRDGNRNGNYEPNQDTFLSLLIRDTLTFDYGISNLAIPLTAGSESFIFTFNFDDSATLSDSFSARIPVNGVKMSSAGSGPLALIIGNGIWTMATSGGLTIVLQTWPVIVPSPIVPAGPDSTILSISILGNTPDTLTACTVALVGSLTSDDIETFSLFADANKSRSYEAGIDTPISGAWHVGSGLYQFGPCTYSLPSGFDSFVFTLNLRDTVDLSDTFQVKIFTNQVNLQSAGAGPIAPVYQAGSWSVAQATSVSLTPGLAGHVIPVTGPETAILAFRASGLTPDTLTACTIVLYGTLPPADVDSVALWVDMNRSGDYEDGIDSFVAILLHRYTAPYTYGYGRDDLGLEMPSGAESFVVTIDVADTASLSDTFGTRLPLNGVILAAGGTAPATPLFVPGEWSLSGGAADSRPQVVVTPFPPGPMGGMISPDPSETLCLVMSFTVLGQIGGDTLTDFAVSMWGSIQNDTSFDTLVLYRDIDRDAMIDTSIDLYIGAPQWNSLASLYTLSCGVFMGGGSDSFLLCARVSNTAVTGETFAATLWSMSSIKTSNLADTGPSTTQTGPYFMVMNNGGLPAVDSFIFALMPTSGKTVVPGRDGETAALSFAVVGMEPDTIAGLAVQFLDRDGFSIGNAAIETCALYTDLNVNGEFDPLIDSPVVALSWNGTFQHWDFGGFNPLIPFSGPGDTKFLLVTIAMNPYTTFPGESIQASLRAGYVATENGWSGPDSPLVNPAVHQSAPGLSFTDASFLIDIDTTSAFGNLYLRVQNRAANFNPSAPESLVVTILNPSAPDTENVYLTEPFPDSGVFTGMLSLSSSASDSMPQNMYLYVENGHTLTAILGPSRDTILVGAGGAPPGTFSVTLLTTSQKIVDVEHEAETGIIAVSCVSQVADTITTFSAQFIEKEGYSLDDVFIETAALHVDVNQSGEYENGIDSLVGYLAWSGGLQAWQMTGLALELSGPSDTRCFVVTLKLNWAEVMGGETLQALLPAGGIWTSGGRTGPATPLVKPAPDQAKPLVYFMSPALVDADTYAENDTAFIFAGNSAADQDPGLAESTVAIVANTGRSDTEIVVLYESGPNTGMFGGSVRLSNLLADSIPFNDALYALSGDMIRVAYGSAGDTALIGPGGGGGSAPVFVYFVDSTGWTPKPVFMTPDTAYILVVDTSANTNVNLAENVMMPVFNIVTGETEQVIAYEEGMDTSYFRGWLPISPDPLDSTPFSMILHAAPGDTIRVLYSDESATAGIVAAPPVIRHLSFMDSSWFGPQSTYPANDSVFVLLIDTTSNTNPGSFEIVTAILVNLVTGETEEVILDEGDMDTSYFRGSLKLSADPLDSSPFSMTLFVTPGDSIRVFYASETATAFILPATPTWFGPDWFVNDENQAGDLYTSATGNDFLGDGSSAAPFRTIHRALVAARAGETVLVDAGVYTETVVIDTNSLRLLGAGKEQTLIVAGDTSAGSALRGIRAQNRSGVVITGLTVTGAYDGLYFDSVANSHVEQVKSTGNGRHGFYWLNNCVSDSLIWCEALANAVDGVRLQDAPIGLCLVRDLQSIGNGGAGVYAWNTNRNWIEACTADSNANEGFAFDGSNDNPAISLNSATGNGQYGYYLNASSRNTVAFNTAAHNAFSGFYVYNSSDSNLFALNLSTGNGQDGFGFDASSHNIAASNTIPTNGRHGFLLSWALNTRVEQNEIHHNAYSQVYLTTNAAGDTVIKNNIGVPAGFPESGIVNMTANSFDFTRNWWFTVDSATLGSMMQGPGAGKISFTPYRLGLVDTAPNADTVAPAAPSVVNAFALDSETIRCTWSFSTTSEEPEISNGINNYFIYISNTPNPTSWTYLGSASFESDYYDVFGLSPGTTRYFKVTSRDDATFVNESWYSGPTGFATTDSGGAAPATLVVTVDTSLASRSLAVSILHSSVNVLSFLVAGDTSSTWNDLAVLFRGGAADQVSNVTLWNDADTDGVFHQATDQYINSLGFDSNGRWYVLSLGTSLGSLPSRFFIVADVYDTTPGDTFQATIPAGAISLSNSAPGPDSPLASSAVFTSAIVAPTVIVDSTLPSRNLATSIAHSSICIFSFDLLGDSESLLQAFDVTLRGGAAEQAGNLCLWNDADSNGTFSSTLDNYVGSLGYDSNGRWFATGWNTPLAGFSARFFVSADVYDTTPGDTFQATIPAGGIVLSNFSAGPVADLPSGAIMTSAIMAPTVTVDSSLPSRNLATSIPHASVNILAFDIVGDSASCLQALAITLSGAAAEQAGNLSVWGDADSNGLFSVVTDAHMGVLSYDSNGLWRSGTWNVALGGSSPRFFITADVLDTTPGDTFRATIPAGGIVLSDFSPGPVADLSSPAVFTSVYLPPSITTDTSISDSSLAISTPYQEAMEVLLLSGDSSSLLSDIAVKMEGGAAGSVTSVDLYHENDSNLVFNATFDGHLGSLSFDSNHTWFASGWNIPLSPYTGRFYVVVSFLHNNPADTLRARIPAMSVRLSNRSPGPAADLVSPAVFTTYMPAQPPLIVSSLSSAPGSASIDPSGADLTWIQTFSVTGDPSGDVLTAARVQLNGSAGLPDRVESVALYIDADENNLFDAFFDYGVTDLPSLGGGLYGSNSLSITLPDWKGGRETFLVVVTFRDTATPSETMQARIPAFSVQSMMRDSGPAVALTAPGVFTLLAARTHLAVDPYRPAGASVAPSGADLTAVMAFTAGGAAPDTLGTLLVGFEGKAGGAALLETVALYRDADQDGDYFAGTDLFVAGLIQAGPARFMLNTAVALPSAESFVVVVSFRDTTPGGETLQAFIPAGGVATTLRAASPDDTTPAASVFITESAVATITGVTVNRSTVSETIAPLWVDLTRVLAFSVQGQSGDDLQEFTVRLQGTAGQVSRLDYIALFRDANNNGRFDSGTDPIVSLLGWMSGQTYGMTGIGHPLGAGGSDTLLLVLSYKDSSPSGETVHAIIPAGGVKSGLMGYGPAIDMAAPAVFTIYDLNPPLPFTLSTPPAGTDTSAAAVTLRWNASADPGSGLASYRVQASSSITFSPLLFDSSTALSRSLNAAFPTEGFYHWRAFAIDAKGNARASTDTGSLLIDRTAPSMPSLVAPADEAETTVSTISFTHSGSIDAGSGIDRYRLQIAATPSFSSISIDSPIGTALAASRSLAGGANYYWRILAQDRAGNTRASDTRRLTVVGGGPSVPVLLSPATALETSSTSILFQWAPSTDTLSAITGYRLQIDPTGLFTAPPVDSGTGLSTSAVRTLSAGQSYSWRVVVANAAGFSTASAIRTLAVDTSCTVALFSPPDGVTTTETRPTFVWISDGDTFRLQLGPDTTGAGLVLDVIQASKTHQPVLPLAAGHWWWRVLAVDLAGNADTSAWRALEIDTGGALSDNTPPAPFALLSPAHGVCTSALSVIFRWSPTTDTPSGVSSYRFRLSTDSLFTTPIYDSSVAATVDTFRATLPTNADLFWQVIAVDGAGNTRSSQSIRHLLTDTVAPTAPSPLLAPASGIETSSASITLRYSAAVDTAAGVALYTIQADTSGSFTAPLLSGTSASTALTLSGFTQGTWWWRAAALDNAGNVSNWVTDTFRVSRTAPSAPTPLSPISGTWTSTTVLSFDWSDAVPGGAALRRYRLRVSLDSSFASAAVDSTTADTTSLLTSAGFTSGTWYWQVFAEDLLGNVSDGSSVASVRVDLSAPPAPSLSSPANNTVTRNASMSIAWMVAGAMPSSGLNGYGVEIIDAQSLLVVDSYFTSSATFYSVTVSGFSETIYAVRVRARSNAGTWSPYSASRVFAFDFTPPAGVPAGLSPVQGAETTTTAVTFAVSSVADTGPAGSSVYYLFQASRTPVFDSTTILTTQRMGSSVFTPTWLCDSTGTYYWRVAAMDTVGNASAWSAACSFTRPVPTEFRVPVSISDLSAAADNALGITLSWTNSPSPDMAGGGAYLVYWNEGRDGTLPDTLFKIVAHNGLESTSYSTNTDTILRSGTYYRFRVAAQDALGNRDTDRTIVGATARLGAVNYPFVTVITPSAGRTVNMTGGVQVQIRVEGLFRALCETLVWQYRHIHSAGWTAMTPAGGGAWQNPKFVGDESRVVYGLHWDASTQGAVSDTDYEIRGVAVLRSGDSAPALSEVVAITLTTNNGNADMSGGSDTSSMNGNAGQNNNLNHSSGDDSQAGLNLPGGSTNENGEDTLSIGLGLDTNPGRGAGGLGAGALNASGLAVAGALDALIGSDTPVGIGVTIEIRNKNGTLITYVLNKSATVFMSAPADTRWSPDSLVVRTQHANGDTQEWRYDSVTNRATLTTFSWDTVNRLVTFQTRQFSSFVLVAPNVGAAVGAPGNQANLSRFILYPNPWRPNNSTATDGLPYDPANPRTTGIVFDNLPARVKIEVFTLRGERVFERSLAVNDGYATWNGKNSANADDVATGYYVYVVTDLATGQKVTGKLAVIR